MKYIRVLSMFKQSIYNENSFYNCEANENLQKLSQENVLLMVKRGRKSSKVNKIDYKVHGKDSPDNIRRKVKTHFHNFMIALLNMKIKDYLSPEERFGKIAFRITQDLTVEYNQSLFKTKIKDIVIVMSSKYSNKNKNKYILSQIMKKNVKNSQIISLLELNYKELYLDYYLKSNKETFKGEDEDESYEAHLEKLEEKYGSKYTNEFKNIAESLIYFFIVARKEKLKRN